MHLFLSGICSYTEMEAGGTELYTQGCHTLLVGVAESYAFHVVSVTILLSSHQQSSCSGQLPAAHHPRAQPRRHHRLRYGQGQGESHHHGHHVI